MDRRRFLVTTLACALAAPLAVEVEQAVKVHRIGMLFAAAQTDEARNLDALRPGRWPPSAPEVALW